MVTPLSLDNMTQPATADEWFAECISLQTTLGLPTTAWQPGSIERCMDTALALVQQESDVAGSIMIQAGFLDFAATGSVTYTDANGVVQTVYVTPDPSIPAQNPTGALGWLDVLSDSLYDVQRIIAARAGGVLAVLNTSVSTYGPFAIGTYHVANPNVAGSPGYTNAVPLTVSPSLSAGSITAPGCTAASSLINVHLVGHPFSTGAPVFITGVTGTTEANGAWYVTRVDANNFTLDGSTFSNAWVSGGTVYAPDVATFTADTAGTASNANPRDVTVSVTSLIGVSVENINAWIGADTEGNIALAARCRLKLQALAIGGTGGQITYYSLIAQEIAPTLTPPLVISAPITRVLVQLITTTGQVYVTAANSAGGISGSFSGLTGDVGALWYVLAAKVGITSYTIITQGAANHTITVAVTVYLPAVYNTATNVTLFTTAILRYFRALPVGGVTLPGGTSPNTNVVPFEGVIGSVFAAAAQASIPLALGDVEGTLDGGTSNVQLLLSPVPEVAVPTVTVNLVSV